MPVDVRWIDDGRVIYERFYGQVTIADLNAAQIMFRALLSGTTQRVHSLIDLRALEDYPRSLSQIRDSLTLLRSNQLGWIVLITHENAVIKFLGSVITQLMIPGASFTICATPQAAIEFLLRQDHSIQLTDAQLD